jgi:hypothetical protein
MREPLNSSLSETEERQASELEAEIEGHFEAGATRPYAFLPDSVAACELSERVKREVIRRARKAGLKASDLDAAGGFTVGSP